MTHAHLDRDLLQIEDQVDRVLDHSRDRCELVQHAVDLDRRDGRPLDRGEQDAPQGVPDRGAEAPLEGLGPELPVGRGERLHVALEALGPLETFPQHSTLLLEDLRGATESVSFFYLL